MKCRKLFANSLLYLLVAATMIVACNINFTGPTPLPQGDCPVQPEREFAAHEFLREKPKYVFILVDKSYKYAYTNEALTYISEKVLLKINPGDRVTIMWMDLDATTNSIFVDRRVEAIDHPQLLPKPELPPYIPTLTINENDPTTTQGDQIIENEEINKANETILTDYYCEVGKWNDESEKNSASGKVRNKVKRIAFCKILEMTSIPLCRRIWKKGNLFTNQFP